MVRKILILAGALIMLWAAPAAAQYPPLIVSPGTVAPGGAVTITGSGCRPGIPVIITLLPGDHTGDARALARALPPGAIVLATGVTGPDGTYTITVTIPPGTTPGVYTIEATCGSHVQDALINVAPASVVTTTPGTGVSGGGGTSGGGPLAHTGTNNIVPFTRIGLALVAAGGLMLLAMRRRRSRTDAYAT